MVWDLMRLHDSPVTGERLADTDVRTYDDVFLEITRQKSEQVLLNDFKVNQGRKLQDRASSMILSSHQILESLLG